jgi:hypothetical protein
MTSCFLVAITFAHVAFHYFYTRERVSEIFGGRKYFLEWNTPKLTSSFFHCRVVPEKNLSTEKSPGREETDSQLPFTDLEIPSGKHTNL